jgi:hypothetical protein
LWSCSICLIRGSKYSHFSYGATTSESRLKEKRKFCETSVEAGAGRVFSPISGGPIEDIWKFDMLRVIRAFQEVEHVELSGMLRQARRNVMVFVEDQIGVFCLITVWRYLACVNGALRVGKERSAFGHAKIINRDINFD